VELNIKLSIAIMYEHADTDEMGIKLTAEEMGIKLVYIPFRKVSVSITNDGYHFKTKRRHLEKELEGVNAVLNRMQSKNARLYAASIMEGLGKYVVNPLTLEYLCFSKFRSLVELWKRGIRIPSTVFVPCDAHDITTSGRKLNNEEDIADLIQEGIGEKDIVLKPDAGTHGRDVRLSKDRKTLIKNLNISTPSIINPIGFVAQEFIEKWFYDLRIIVAKERGKPPYCYPTALARGGFKDFRTNTFLGNMVFGVKLPRNVRNSSIQCGKAMGRDSEAWVLGLDAMFNIGEDRFVDDEYVKSELEKLVPSFDSVKAVKREKIKTGHFSNWNKKLEDAFQNYMNTEHYERIKEIIEESIARNADNILFHEANSCPEFWEQTRIVGGINVAIPLIKCAQSVAGWSVFQKYKRF
jgi:glutathione synthase/RimK-type ligase-like ATP-grasp enzyme